METQFHPNTSKIYSTAIWVRLPQLPIEFYDLVILERISWKIDKFLKVDACTSLIIRGFYAQIYVQVDLGKTVKTSVNIGNHKQLLVYEGENILYKLCGYLGHIAQNWSDKISP